MINLHYALTAAARLFLTVASFGSAFAMLWLSVLDVVPILPIGEFIFCITIGILTYPRLTITIDGEQDAQEDKQGSHSSTPSSKTKA